MKKVRLILFLLIFGMFVASIPGTPVSPVYKHSTVRADDGEGDGDHQPTCGDGRGKTCVGCTWVCFPAFCICIPDVFVNP